MEISYDQSIGTRESQEDFFVIQTNRTSVSAHVLDGHNGEDCASLCASCLEQDIIPCGDVKGENKEIIRGLQMIAGRFIDRGTTLSSVYIIDGALFVSILGDSPVFPIYKGKVKKLPLHDITNKTEFKKVAKKGVYNPAFADHIFNREGSGLSCFRAIGDKNMEGIIGRVPDFYEIKEWDSVVIASDGLKLPHKEIASLINYGAKAINVKNRDFLCGKPVDNTTIICITK